MSEGKIEINDEQKIANNNLKESNNEKELYCGIFSKIGLIFFIVIIFIIAAVGVPSVIYHYSNRLTSLDKLDNAVIISTLPPTINSTLTQARISSIMEPTISRTINLTLSLTTKPSISPTSDPTTEPTIQPIISENKTTKTKNNKGLLYGLGFGLGLGIPILCIIVLYCLCFAGSNENDLWIYEIRRLNLF